MMHMTFYWGKKVTILFDSWRTDSWPSYGLSLVALFFLAAFYQYMENRRIGFKILTRSKPSIETPLFGANSRRRIAAPAKIAVAVLFGVNSAIGYLLMLSVMSFNGGVFVTIVLGLAIGYLAFRSSEDEDSDSVENPCACS